MKKILLLILALLIVVLGVVFFKLSQPKPLSSKEANAAAQKLLGREVRGPKVDKGTQHYNGKFFDLSYPGYLEILNRKDAQTPSVLETLVLQEFAPRENVVIQVLKQPSGSLEEFSSVALRAGSSDYKEESVQVDGLEAIKFTKDSSRGVEIAVFVKKSDRVYSLVVSGGSIEESEKIYKFILPTFSLK